MVDGYHQAKIKPKELSKEPYLKIQKDLIRIIDWCTEMMQSGLIVLMIRLRISLIHATRYPTMEV